MEDSTILPVSELLAEWETLINELSDKEVALYEWKTIYQIQSDKIIAETNFKELYGANNQKVRDNHIKNELAEWHQNLKELEWSIDYLTRRISFLRQLVHTKTVLMEVKK